MPKYEVELINNHTGEKKYLSSNSQLLLDEKISKQNEKWEKEQYLSNRLDEAIKKTTEAQAKITKLKNLLTNSLGKQYTYEWEKDLLVETFPEYQKEREPKIFDFLTNHFILNVSFLSFIPYIEKKCNNAKIIAKEDFKKAHSKWEADEEKKRNKYDKDKKEFEIKQKKHNDTIEGYKTDYIEGKNPGLLYYFTNALKKLNLPIKFSFQDLHYKEDSKLLILNVLLPNPEDIPKSIEYRYIKARDEIEVKEMKSKEYEELYDDAIYQLVFAIVNATFQFDTAGQLDLIVLNGIRNAVDKKTGKESEKYILSLQISKKEFEDINLYKINPKDSFRHFKGCNAGSFVDFTSIKPIINFSTNDDRFIEAENVLDGLDQSKNLATMDWQKFEVLIRDIIRKEFEREGCKVEVTQASRDDGVDAVAFDEDPIRGGKFIIQAKRYNITTPISAVRELESVVRQEGAVKGILVTTSHFGKDSYEFARNKPLTLLDGNNLLNLFQNHGYNMTISVRKK